MENENVNVNEKVDNNLNTETDCEDLEIDKSLTQEEFDKALTRRLSREKSKWEKEYSARLESEKKELEELAKLSEKEKQQKLFDKQVKEFEETKKAFERERLLNQTSKDLASKNLPIEFSEILLGADAEKTLENINTFEAKFNAALEKAVTERFKSPTPKTSTSKGEDLNPYTMEGWSLTKQMELEMSNPSLAVQLRNSVK